MRNKLHILRIALCCSAIFLFSCALYGQKGILELLPGTYKLSFDEKTGAHKLSGGGVNFNYQGNTLYCDSALFFEKKNQVKAYGKVHLNKNDTLNLFCDSLWYNGNTKKALLWGNVRVRDREYKLATDSLEYDARTGRGIYRHGGKIESILQNEVLTSKIGHFYPDSKNFFFGGDVKYRSDSLQMDTDTLRYQYLKKMVFFYGPTHIRTKDAVFFCEKGWYNTQNEEGVLEKNAKIIKDSKIIQGDSLYTHLSSGISVGKGNVSYSDSTSKISLKGEYAYMNEKQRFNYVTRKALGIYRLKEDTLYIHADTLFSFQDSLNELSVLRANYDVQLYSKDFQGKCDSLVFDKKKDVAELYRAPIGWSRNAELKGNFMKVHLRDSIIDRVEIIDKATAVMEIDSGNYYNQIGGKNMMAFFKDNELVRVEVTQNAQTIYFPQDTLYHDTVVEIKRSGMARLYASNLKVYLDSGEVTGIVYLGMPDGVLYPMQQINKEEQFVKGFSWNPVLRPRSVEDLFVPAEEKKKRSEAP